MSLIPDLFKSSNDLLPENTKNETDTTVVEQGNNDGLFVKDYEEIIVQSPFLVNKASEATETAFNSPFLFNPTQVTSEADYNLDDYYSDSDVFQQELDNKNLSDDQEFLSYLSSLATLEDYDDNEDDKIRSRVAGQLHQMLTSNNIGLIDNNSDPMPQLQQEKLPINHLNIQLGITAINLENYQFLFFINFLIWMTNSWYVQNKESH